MTSQELIQEIRQFCIANADESIVKKYSRYFKGEHNAYGISQPLLDGKIDELLAEKDVSLELVLDAAPGLLASPKYEDTSFVLLMTDRFQKRFDRVLFDAIGSWFRQGIHNWAHADMLGMTLLPRFLEKSVVEPEDFRPWLSAENPFQRRCVPVTFIKHIKKNHHAIAPLFEFLSPLMSDPVREVHQGIGWYLREAWKIAPVPTEAFLSKWKDTAPRLIFQYACEKMPKERKEAFRRNKRMII